MFLPQQMHAFLRFIFAVQIEQAHHKYHAWNDGESLKPSIWRGVLAKATTSHMTISKLNWISSLTTDASVSGRRWKPIKRANIFCAKAQLAPAWYAVSCCCFFDLNSETCCVWRWGPLRLLDHLAWRDPPAIKSELALNFDLQLCFLFRQSLRASFVKHACMMSAAVEIPGLGVFTHANSQQIYVY